MSLPSPFVSALIIPTGIGASVGGFAGDATPVMNLLASVSDVLITHPNVANAAMFQKLPENALYVEGYGLDQFFKGRWGLQPVRQNRIGVILDAGISPAMRVVHHNTINAVRSVYGVAITDLVETSEPVEISYGLTASGCSGGSLKNPAILLEAAQRLIQQGTTALALCVQFPDLEDQAADAAYQQAGGVDPVGGVEAILSHWLVSQLQLPCAHSPVFSVEAALPELQTIVDSRAAAEYITPTFLPCVLTGLHKAPQFVNASAKPEVLTIDDLDVLIVPGDALGGAPVLAALSRGIPVIAVAENHTACRVTPEHLEHPNVIPARSYLEAAGLCAALRAGISLDVLRSRSPENHTGIVGEVHDTARNFSMRPRS